MMRPWVAVAGILCCCALLEPAQSRAANPDTVRASIETITPEYHAFAQVLPKRIVTVRASATGVVGALSVLPGDRVRSGQVLAVLGGAEFKAELRKARAMRDNEKRDLDLVRQNYPHFSSAGDVANARAAFEEARAGLDRIEAAEHIAVPCNGVVLAVKAADGERHEAGDALIVVQPTAGLWLNAEYYGAAVDLVHTGMAGEFTAADGSGRTPVKVVTRFAALASDGGETIGLVAATTHPAWHNGEFGSVTLRGAARRAIVVPSRALVLDQGHWFVIVSTPHGLRPRKVVPGPTRGWQTVVEQGLEDGTSVVVENAGLDFHRSIAKDYMPPD